MYSFPSYLRQQDLPYLYTWPWVGVSCFTFSSNRPLGIIGMWQLLGQDDGLLPSLQECSGLGSTFPVAPLGLCCRKYFYPSPGAKVACFYSSLRRINFCPWSEVRGFVFVSPEGRIWGSRQGFVCYCLYPCLQSYQVPPVFPCHWGRLCLVSWLFPIFPMSTKWRLVVPDILQFTLTFKNLLRFWLVQCCCFLPYSAAAKMVALSLEKLIPLWNSVNLVAQCDLSPLKGSGQIIIL